MTRPLEPVHRRGMRPPFMSARCLLTHAAAAPLTWHDRSWWAGPGPAMGIRQPAAKRDHPVAPSLPEARPADGCHDQADGCNGGGPVPFRAALAKTATTSLSRT